MRAIHTIKDIAAEARIVRGRMIAACFGVLLLAGLLVLRMIQLQVVEYQHFSTSLLDFTNSGPVVGPRVVAAVEIPVIGGFGGGPWLDGRVRMAHAAIGYAAKNLDQEIETYANVARTAFDAITAVADDVRSARQIKGGPSKNN